MEKLVEGVFRTINPNLLGQVDLDRMLECCSTYIHLAGNIQRRCEFDPSVQNEWTGSIHLDHVLWVRDRWRLRLV